MAKKCSAKKKITLIKKNGKCVKRDGECVTFMGRQGSDCPPRKKPSTRHLKAWKDVMKKASPQCAKRGGGAKAIAKCVGQAIRSVKG